MKLQNLLPDKKYITDMKKKESFLGLKIYLNVVLDKDDKTPGTSMIERLLDDNNMPINVIRKGKNSFFDKSSAVYMGSDDGLEYKIKLNNFKNAGEDISLRIRQRGHKSTKASRLVSIIKDYVSEYDAKSSRA